MSECYSLPGIFSSLGLGSCDCVSVFLCAVLLMGQVPEIKWIGLDWIGLDWIARVYRTAIAVQCW